MAKARPPRRIVKANTKAKEKRPDPKALEAEVRTLSIKVKALEDSLERLVSAVNQNNGAYGKAFNLTDAHLWVHNQISVDMASLVAPRGALGNLAEGYDGPLKLTNDGQLDLAAYYQAFNEKQERERVEAEARKRKEAKTSSPEAAEVFGGDYEHVESQKRNEGGQATTSGEGSGKELGNGNSAPASVP